MGAPPLALFIANQRWDKEPARATTSACTTRTQYVGERLPHVGPVARPVVELERIARRHGLSAERLDAIARDLRQAGVEIGS